MTPIVNQKYKYILMYNAKSGCTSLRSLYLSVHKDEMTDNQLATLDFYHNLNLVQPFDEGADYSDYFIYAITRNPYLRVVSAFLDQYAYVRNSGVQAMLDRCPPQGDLPNSFIEFLEYLRTVPDGQRDTHFQCQSYLPYPRKVVTKAMSKRYRFFGKKPEGSFAVNLIGDISNFDKVTKRAFRRIFKGDKAKHRFALDQLEAVKTKNSSFYGEENHPLASCFTLDQLNEMVFAPKPQDFFDNPRAVELTNEIYQDDFRFFGYKLGKLPHKNASKEIALIPKDFDWKMYLQLNPDLPHSGINNERSVVRHYLEFGRFEATPRAYKIEAPAGFDWQRYLALNSDLESEGITSEAAAVEHYISYGIRQERPIC